jgi:hypothetical protein
VRLSKEAQLFEVRGAVSPDGIAKLELPQPHWVLWGQPGNFLTIVDGTDPDRRTNFKILIQFSAERRVDFVGNLSLRASDVSANGDSNYGLANAEASAYVSNGEKTLRFTPLLNSEKHLAGMESDVLEDVSFDDAITCALTFARRVERILCVMTKVPLFVEVIQVESIDTHQAYTRSSYAYPNVSISKFMTPEIGCMSPLLSTYAEGMRELSPFYRFLCFFKLVDKLLSKVNGALQRLALSKGVAAPNMNSEMPTDPFSVVLPSVVGRRYTWVRDTLQSRFRNVIAHLDLASPVEPFNLESEFDVSKCAMALAYISEDLLRRAYDFLLELKRLGCDLDELRF